MARDKKIMNNLLEQISMEGDRNTIELVVDLLVETKTMKDIDKIIEYLSS